MPQFRRFRRGRRGPRLPLRWTGTQDTAENAIAATTLETQGIVIPGDYAQGTSMEQSTATLMRVVGQLNLRNTAGVPNVVSGCIYVAHGSLGGQQPNVYNDTMRFGGTLWHWTGVLMANTFGEAFERIDIDLRSRRKLEGDAVVLTLFGTQTFAYATTLRALLKVT